MVMAPWFLWLPHWGVVTIKGFVGAILYGCPQKKPTGADSHTIGF